jgi:hypothetical protein
MASSQVQAYKVLPLRCRYMNLLLWRHHWRFLSGNCRLICRLSVGITLFLLYLAGIWLSNLGKEKMEIPFSDGFFRHLGWIGLPRQDSYIITTVVGQRTKKLIGYVSYVCDAEKRECAAHKSARQILRSAAQDRCR